jgi:alcohol dehydrogenase (cytochrome c)
MKLRTALLSASFFVGTLFAGASAQTVNDAMLLKQHPDKDWLMYSGDYSSQRFSTLSQINRTNIGKLQAKWVYHMPNAKDLEPVPIVVNGIMYVSQFNRMDALDARSGNLIWQYAYPPVNPGWQRGSAIYGNKVFVTRTDGHLVALDTRTGSVIWDVKAENGTRGSAPMMVHGKLIVNGSSYVQAFDPETGKQLWSWTGLPKESDPAYKSWGGQKPQGIGMWLSGSYDPDLNLLYVGTGQPSPTGIGETRMGDNLYSDSMVALDPDTGTMKWYFQFTPHDTLDYDATEMPVLVDANVKGKPRKLLLLANRNGYYYVLDRTNGEFISGTPFVSKITWASGLDEKGRPNKLPGKDPTVQGNEVCPATAGATNWPSPTYSPQTHLFYVFAVEGCGVHFRATSAGVAEVYGLRAVGGEYTESADNPWQSHLRALDAVTGKQVWDYELVRSNHYGPGLMATAGGLIFAGEQFGHFSALDAKSGKLLWTFNTGDIITAAPVTYLADGKQMVAIASSTDIIGFGLPDNAPPNSGAKDAAAAAAKVAPGGKK